ncbi:MAG: laccase domain-containing protein, partial [Eubacteriales bacterium]|nr:laccase domain-containing protein [Eubacteriales bacterium]
MIDSAAFVKKEKDGVAYYAIPFLDDMGLVTTAFSTRHGGVSTGETARMNLGMYRKDTRENVRENYRRLFSAAGLDPHKAVLSRQVHGTDYLLAGPERHGLGLWDDSRVSAADALLCAHPGTALVKHSADCASLFVLDPVHKAIALAHS